MVIAHSALEISRPRNRKHLKWKCWNPFVACIKNKDTFEVILEIAGGKHLTEVMFMHIFGFGIVSCASLPRLRNRISVCERVGAGELDSGFCAITGFSVRLGRSLPFPEQDSDS